MKKALKDCRLYGILDMDYVGHRDPAMVARQMVEGGVDLIQIRAKKLKGDSLRSLTHRVMNVLRQTPVRVVVNDHPEIAAEFDVDGVHVGQDDMRISKVRELVGAWKWIGRSTHSLSQARTAVDEGADYIGVGPIFATPTKPDYRPVGLGLIREVRKNVKVPFFCIGGIKLENLDQVLNEGADRVVVVSGILKAERPIEYCRELKGMLLERRLGRG